MLAWNLLADLLTLLAVALVLGALCERLRQSAIIGYLLAGGLLGPHAFGVVGSGDMVVLLAELGVALLLFSIGLEVSWTRLRACGRAALLGGAMQVVLAAGIGATIAWTLGLEGRQAVLVGAALALSSTASVLRLLQARAELDTQHGRHALGVLLVQDVAVVPLVLIVSSMQSEGSFGEFALSLAKEFGLTALMVGGFFILFTVVIPRMLDLTTTLRNRELPVLLALVTGLGSALLAHQLGVSPAIGAFVAGLLLAGSPYSILIRADVSAVRTVFMTLFFSSIGMLADPAWAMAHTLPILGAVVLLILTKIGVLWGILRLFAVPSQHALATGVALAQAGEFALVLLGVGSDLVSHDLFMLLTSATIVTLLLTPSLVFLAGRVAGARVSVGDAAEAGTAGGNHAVVVGFGPAGQGLVESLVSAGLRVKVIDLNPKLVDAARSKGIEASVGDATHPDVLEHASVASCCLVGVTLPDDRVAVSISRQVKSLASSVPVVARGRYHMHLDRLRDTGAEVVDEEWTVGEELGRRALDLLELASP